MNSSLGKSLTWHCSGGRGFLPLGRSQEDQPRVFCQVFFLTYENPAKVMEDDIWLIPAISNGTAVNASRQVRNAHGREIMEVLKGLRTLVASHQVHDTRTNLGCRIPVNWSGCFSRIARQPRADVPCSSLPEAHEEGKGFPS